MYWRYRAASGRDERLRQLLDVFRQLLLVLNGDVDAALDQLEWIGKRYELFGDGLGIDEVRALLDKRGEILRAQDGTHSLTRKGERALRRQALDQVFRGVTARGPGDHRTPQPGGSGEASDEVRPWTFGDASDALDASATLTNWLRRTGGADHMREEDLAVRERERHTTCATVLLIDVSHSMTLYGEDRITPAKRVALALTELILTKYPKDTIDVVLFGDEAVSVPLEKLPYITNGPFHTNTCAGLARAQDILRRRKAANRQIVMLTDGKPSAIHEEGGIYKNPFGLDARIVARTLDEARRCRRKQIRITTFMLTTDPHLRRFVERFTEVCQGRAWFAESSKLESYVLVDFLRNRKRRMR